MAEILSMASPLRFAALIEWNVTLITVGAWSMLLLVMWQNTLWQYSLYRGDPNRAGCVTGARAKENKRRSPVVGGDQSTGVRSRGYLGAAQECERVLKTRNTVLRQAGDGAIDRRRAGDLLAVLLDRGLGLLWG